MGADIYDWDRVGGKGSYQAMIDGACSEGRHERGCSHGEPPHVWPAEAALETAYEATKEMGIDAGTPHERLQRAEFLVIALRAAWSALGERTEKAENLVARVRRACRENPSTLTAGDVLRILGGEGQP